MSTDDARGLLAEALDAVVSTHCPRCFRPMASESDWESAEEGERPDLCWEDVMTCGWVSEKTTAEFYADALLASPQLARLIEQREATARAEALREAAEAWAHSEWSNVLLPKPTPPAVPVIAYANRVGDWLRDRAVLAGQGGEDVEGA